MTAEHGDGQEWLVHRQGFRWPVPPVFYDLAARLESMDRRGIGHAVLSAAPQLFMYWPTAARRPGFCRAVNDALAAFAAGSGGRITAVATLPMQDPGAAVANCGARSPNWACAAPRSARTWRAPRWTIPGRAPCWPPPRASGCR